MRRYEALKKANITHVVSALRLPLDKDLFVKYKHHIVELDDLEDENVIENFAGSNAFIQEGLDGGGGVLVHWWVKSFSWLSLRNEELRATNEFVWKCWFFRYFRSVFGSRPRLRFNYIFASPFCSWKSVEAHNYALGRNNTRMLYAMTPFFYCKVQVSISVRSPTLIGRVEQACLFVDNALPHHCSPAQLFQLHARWIVSRTYSLLEQASSVQILYIVCCAGIHHKDVSSHLQDMLVQGPDRMVSAATFVPNRNI